MEENYIRIFCTHLAHLLDSDQVTMEEVAYVIQDFDKVAPNIHSRQDLLNFLRDYQKFGGLTQQLQDPGYIFTFND